ncbi:hypothetical protein DSO57_1027407 [Entomophthora muscae]|uniref:Uncharacterized protein n=1 Tax=Entomophthora muscae TaxID=34485 RepID=A0ACC2T1X6_9FUNG|nr:hypothetical protein DSO57_1027407 [Entomophthora muscae]
MSLLVAGAGLVKPIYQLPSFTRALPGFYPAASPPPSPGMASYLCRISRGGHLKLRHHIHKLQSPQVARVSNQHLSWPAKSISPIEHNPALASSFSGYLGEIAGTSWAKAQLVAPTTYWGQLHDIQERLASQAQGLKDGSMKFTNPTVTMC